MKARIDLGKQSVSTPWGLFRFMDGDYDPATGVIALDTQQGGETDLMGHRKEGEGEGRKVPPGILFDTRARVLIRPLAVATKTEAKAKGKEAAA